MYVSHLWLMATILGCARIQHFHSCIMLGTTTQDDAKCLRLLHFLVPQSNWWLNKWVEKVSLDFTKRGWICWVVMCKTKGNFFGWFLIVSQVKRVMRGNQLRNLCLPCPRCKEGFPSPCGKSESLPNLRDDPDLLSLHLLLVLTGHTSHFNCYFIIKEFHRTQEPQYHSFGGEGRIKLNIQVRLCKFWVWVERPNRFYINRVPHPNYSTASSPVSSFQLL